MESTQTKMAEMKDCNKCSLRAGTIQVVPPIKTHAITNIMLIGEGPGAAEEAKGKPFVGQSGQLLQKILGDIGLTQNLYITNVVKCRPPNNRTPNSSEINTCTKNWLAKELKLEKPKVIVCLGKTASDMMQDFFGLVQKMYRGNKQIKVNGENILMIFTYHPAYILRAPSKKFVLENSLRQALEATQTYREEAHSLN